MRNVPRFTFTNVVRKWPKMPVEGIGHTGDVHHVTSNLCHSHSIFSNLNFSKATLESNGLEYNLVNIWSLSQDFHKLLEQAKLLRKPKIENDFNLTSWFYPTHPKKGTESKRILSTVSELRGQKVHLWKQNPKHGIFFPVIALINDPKMLSLRVKDRVLNSKNFVEKCSEYILGRLHTKTIDKRVSRCILATV